MSYTKGEKLLLSINTGTDAVPVWTKVGRATTNDWVDTLELIRVNNKDSNSFRESIAGEISMTTNITVMMFVGEAGQDAMNTACLPANRKNAIHIKLEDEETSIIGNAFILSRSKSGSNNEVATATYSMEFTGSWTETAIP